MCYYAKKWDPDFVVNLRQLLLGRRERAVRSANGQSRGPLVGRGSGCYYAFRFYVKELSAGELPNRRPLSLKASQCSVA